MVTSGLRAPAQERVGAEGQGRGGLPPRQLQGAVQDPGEQPILPAQPSQAAGPVAEGPLRGGREAQRQAPGSRGQVPGSAQVPLAQDHLGRRGDELLLQGEVADCTEGVVLT